MGKFIHESWLVVLLGCGFAMALGATQAALGPRIAQNKRAVLERAITEVVPGTTRFEEGTIVVSRTPLKLFQVFKCQDASNKEVGWAVRADGFGFQDKIDLVFGLSPDGKKIIGMVVLDNKETPGLGNKIEEANWRNQYVGIDATAPIVLLKEVRKDKDHEVQAITGATISSRAVTRIINSAAVEVAGKLGEWKKLH